eukprot:COSAG02_NODE_7751_length_2862_cov_3.193992_6_plen_145_part_00
MNRAQKSWVIALNVCSRQSRRLIIWFLKMSRILTIHVQAKFSVVARHARDPHLFFVALNIESRSCCACIQTTSHITHSDVSDVRMLCVVFHNENSSLVLMPSFYIESVEQRWLPAVRHRQLHRQPTPVPPQCTAPMYRAKESSQ